MFRRGGPANDGIMSGIEDRKQLANGTGLDVDRARLESMAISNIMDELAPIPKTRLQAAQMAIDKPRQALARFGQGIAGITPGAGSIRIGEAPAAAGASPLMKALGLGLAGADIYGRIFT